MALSPQSQIGARTREYRVEELPTSAAAGKLGAAEQHSSLL